MSPLIPHDPGAEKVVAACAVATLAGAELAADRVDASDFYDPALGRVFTAAVALIGITEAADRVTRVAARAGVAEAEVWRLVDEAGCAVRSQRHVRRSGPGGRPT